MTLRVIEGGGGDNADLPFIPHPLADHLWNALYPKGVRANGDQTAIAVVAARMSRSTGTLVTEAKVSQVVRHVRDNADSYGWTVPPVQKGRTAPDRKYIVALVDPNDPDTMIEESESGDHLIVVTRGSLSATRTMVTMGQHVAEALEIFANATQLSRVEKREVRTAASAVFAAVKMVRDVAGKLETSAQA